MKRKINALKSTVHSEEVLPADNYVDLQQNFEDQLKDVLHGGKKLNNALPRLSALSGKEELHAAYKNHLQETKNQLKRLLHVFELLGKKVIAKKKDLAADLHFNIEVPETNTSFNEQEMQTMSGNEQAEHVELAALKAVAGVMDMKECHGM